MLGNGCFFFFFSMSQRQNQHGDWSIQGVNSLWWVCITTIPINYKPAPQPQLMFLQTELESGWCLELGVWSFKKVE
jgi:hypothetical protein